MVQVSLMYFMIKNQVFTSNIKFNDDIKYNKSKQTNNLKDKKKILEKKTNALDTESVTPIQFIYQGNPFSLYTVYTKKGQNIVLGLSVQRKHY